MTTMSEWLQIHKKVEEEKKHGHKTAHVLKVLGVKESAYTSALYNARQQGLIPGGRTGRGRARTPRVKNGKVAAKASRMVQYAPVDEGRIEVQIGSVKLSVQRSDTDALRTVLQLAEEMNQ